MRNLQNKTYHKVTNMKRSYNVTLHDVHLLDLRNMDKACNNFSMRSLNKK